MAGHPHPERLYEDDFVAWTRDQSRVLRDLATLRPNLPLDLPHLAEEIEDLGVSERREARSQIRRLLEHLLKLEYSPSRDPRGGWLGSAIDARAQLDDTLTVSLRHDIAGDLPKLYENARQIAGRHLQQHGETMAARALPAICPYDLDDLLRDEWYPPNRHGIIDTAIDDA